MTQEIFILFHVLVFLYGIIIGSFLNVCIYRIPKGESIVTVGSHCLECNHKLKWYDLFPLFSWLFLRGRCRYCGTKISIQYPLIEAANGILYVVIFLVNGWSIESALWCILTSALLVLSVIDYRTMRIPRGINLIILLIGVCSMAYHFNNWYYYLIGFFSVSLFLLLCLILTKGRGIGQGDIILMACAGLCLGWGHIFLALVIGSVTGSVVQGIKLAVTKEGRKFAFGPYLSLGIWVAMLFGNSLYDWYFQTVILGF